MMSASKNILSCINFALSGKKNIGQLEGKMASRRRDFPGLPSAVT